MFALEDRPFLRFPPFFALFPDSYLSLSSARSRPAASSLAADAGPTRSPRVRHENRCSPATLSLLSLPNKPASPLQKRFSPTLARTMNNSHTLREQAF
jgi:hypothetical protein